MAGNRETKKESKVLSILYWRKVCQRLVKLLRELEKLKQYVGDEALRWCSRTLDIYKENKQTHKELTRLRLKKENDKRKRQT